MDAVEPQGMFLGLVVLDTVDSDASEIARMAEHRWIFRGALELAKQGRSTCFFIKCLLELQRNVQLEEEKDALDPSLLSACRLFVTGNCREGRQSEMYQLLTHFVSNTLLFAEWHRYLMDAFVSMTDSPSSVVGQYLDQVWGRFKKFTAAVQEMFKALDNRYVWRHRLPSVNDLLHQQMRRRCFSSEVITRHEIFVQEQGGGETVRDIRSALGLD